MVIRVAVCVCVCERDELHHAARHGGREAARERERKRAVVVVEALRGSSGRCVWTVR